MGCEHHQARKPERERHIAMNINILYITEGLEGQSIW
jgi:hypothetical protein